MQSNQTWLFGLLSSEELPIWDGREGNNFGEKLRGARFTCEEGGSGAGKEYVWQEISQMWTLGVRTSRVLGACSQAAIHLGALLTLMTPVAVPTGDV